MAKNHRPAGRVTRPRQADKGVSFLQDDSGMYEIVLDCGKLKFIVRIGGQFQKTDLADKLPAPQWLAGFAQGGTVALPSETQGYGTIDELAAAVRAQIHAYFDCPPQFESLAVLFVLMTWLYDAFQAVPYLRFLGIAGTGKSRGSDVVGSLCYRRLGIAGAATPASIYHMIETVGGTLFIDEADFAHSGIGTEIAKILNCGYQRGSPVVRMEKTPDGDFQPRAYEVFGPKILNGRNRFSDDATESRCLTLVTRETERSDIPTQLPPEFQEEALSLRNKLLRFRYDYLDKMEVKNFHIEGIGRRTNQIILPLLLIGEELTDRRYKDDLLAYARDLDAQTRQDRRETLDAALVAAYVALSRSDHPLTCGNVRQSILMELGEDPEVRTLSPRKVGSMARTLGFTTHRTKHGTVLSIHPTQLKSLCERFSIVTQQSPGSSPQASASAAASDDSDDEVTIPTAA
jgi:hypothetical protein